MPDLKQRLKVEFENIEKSLAELPLTTLVIIPSTVIMNVLH